MSEIFRVRRRPEGEIAQFDFGNKVYFKFSAAHKDLQIKFYPCETRQMMVAETFVENTVLDEHVPGLTTALYGEACELIRGVAVHLNEPVLYLFETQNERMKRWAEDPEKGKGVFEWDEFFQTGKILFARKKIYPQSTGAITDK